MQTIVEETRIVMIPKAAEWALEIVAIATSLHIQPCYAPCQQHPVILPHRIFYDNYFLYYDFIQDYKMEVYLQYGNKLCQNQVYNYTMNQQKYKNDRSNLL